MGAFSIAFDTIIVGSLALAWVLLVIHLFFSDKEPNIAKLLDWVSKQNQPALAGVLLFAIAYSLGSAVSRIAQDFFDDDDMHFHIGKVLFRVGVTESSIRTDVYCRTLPSETEIPKAADPMAKKRAAFKDNNPDCTYTGRWILRQAVDPATNHKITATWLSFVNFTTKLWCCEGLPLMVCWLSLCACSGGARNFNPGCDGRCYCRISYREPSPHGTTFADIRMGRRLWNSPC
jgi:hypothetical protein